MREEQQRISSDITCNGRDRKRYEQKGIEEQKKGIAERRGAKEKNRRVPHREAKETHCVERQRN